MDRSTTRLPSLRDTATGDVPSAYRFLFAMTFFIPGRLSGLAPTYFDAVLNARLRLAHGGNIDAVLEDLHRRYILNGEKLTINHAVQSFDDIAADASLTPQRKGHRVLERIAAQLTPALGCHADEHAAAVCARDVAALLGDRAFQELETGALAEATGNDPMGGDTATLYRRHGTNITLDGGRVAIHKTTDWMHRDELTQRAVLTSDIVLSLQLERADNVVAQAAGAIRRRLGNQDIKKQYLLTADVTECCLSSNDSQVQKTLDTVQAGFWDKVKTLLENLLGAAGVCFHPVKPWRKLELLETRPRALNEAAPPQGAAGEPSPALEIGRPAPYSAWLRSHRTDGWGQAKPNATVGLEVTRDTVTRQDGEQTVSARLHALERAAGANASHGQAGDAARAEAQADVGAGAQIGARISGEAQAPHIVRDDLPDPEQRTAPALAQLSDDEVAAWTQTAYFNHLARLHGNEAAVAAVEGRSLKPGEPLTPAEIERMDRIAKNFSGVGSAKQLAHVVVVEIWPENVRKGNYGHAAATIRGPKVIADGPSGRQAWPKSHHSLWPAQPPLTPLNSVDSYASRSYRADKYNMVSDRAAERLASGDFELRAKQKLYPVGDEKRAALSADKIYLPLFGTNALDDRSAQARPCLFGLSASRMRDRWRTTSQADFRLWSMKHNCAGSIFEMLRAGGAGLFAKNQSNHRGGVLPSDARKYAALVAAKIDALNQKADRLIGLYQQRHHGDSEISLKAAWENYAAHHDGKVQPVLTPAEVQSDDPLVLMGAARRLLQERDLEIRPDALGLLCGLRNRLCELSEADRGAPSVATHAPPALGLLTGLA